MHVAAGPGMQHTELEMLRAADATERAISADSMSEAIQHMALSMLLSQECDAADASRRCVVRCAVRGALWPRE